MDVAMEFCETESCRCAVSELTLVLMIEGM
jgi:hypothetical protein